MSQILQTERLLLRPPDANDAATLTVLFSDYEVSKNTTRMAYPYRRSDAERFIAETAQARRKGEGFAFAIGRRSDSYCLGVVGLHFHGAAFELGYSLGRPYWGRGYATEAARAVVGLGFDVLKLGLIAAGWFHDNPPSGRVLDKLGFVPCGEGERASVSRGTKVACHEMILTRAEHARRKEAP